MTVRPANTAVTGQNTPIGVMYGDDAAGAGSLTASMTPQLAISAQPRFVSLLCFLSQSGHFIAMSQSGISAIAEV